ncbi:MAG: hypothetical protein ABR564_02795 [Candidatus Dormibacteria bacterium]
MSAVPWQVFLALTPGPDTLGVGSTVASPLLTAAEFLIPTGVAMSGVHKMMSHQESGGGFLVDMVIKGGGAVLVVQLIKTLTGLP